MALLQVENLSVTYKNQSAGHEVVKRVSFHAEAGKITGIVGESGCGKTTLMRALMGLLPANAEVECDRILLGEKDIYGSQMEQVRGSQISMIFQEPSVYLDDALTIGRQIADTVRAHNKCTVREARRRAEELLDLVGFSPAGDFMKKYSFELSGGMCQRAAIAMALACQPKLLIADEPTTALDALVQGQILGLLRRIVKETGTAILLVSHDLGVIASVCSRVLVMQQGEIVEEGQVEDVFYLPEHSYTKELISLSVRKRHARFEREDGEWKNILELNHVTKTFGVQEAVKEVSLSIHEGEIFGLAGESGCGKTTLAKMVTGLIKPDAGQILYDGNEVEVIGKWKKRRGQAGIQMVFQSPASALNPALTVRGMLEDALLASKEARKDEVDGQVCRVLEQVGLKGEDADKYPHEFSGGQKQRLVLARALILRPRLLICDEPVSALDISIQEQILDLLTEVQNQTKIAGLLISHDLDVIKYRSNRVGIMYQGHLVESGPTEEVCRLPWHPYTKVLLESVLTPDPFRARKRKPVSRIQSKLEGGQNQCPFAPYCGYVRECCKRLRPQMYRFGEREVACFLYSQEQGKLRSSGYIMGSQI